jgi:hypothetical protein
MGGIFIHANLRQGSQALLQSWFKGSLATL